LLNYKNNLLEIQNIIFIKFFEFFIRMNKLKNIIFRKIRKIDWKKFFNKGEAEKSFRKALKSPYLYLILGFVVGILFTIQFKTESRRPLNPILFYNELKDVKEDFFTKKQDLNNQIKKLQDEITEKEKALANRKFISQSLFNNLTEQELIFGSADIIGGGIVITLSDGDYQIKDEFSKSLAHAADLRDIVNLLWYAGAEAISINEERIIYNTSIDCLVNTIVINNNNYVPPFEIKAIGNKYDLYGIINGSRKLLDIKKRAAKKQIAFSMEMRDAIKIKGYSGVYPNF